MKYQNEIRIKPAVGGFVLEYSGCFCELVTEVISSDAKLLKRIREILDQRNAEEKSRQEKLHQATEDLEKATKDLIPIQLNE